MQAMKGATMALGSMNRTMNLPSLQRIAMEFERENDIMEQRQEMMDDAIDDAMDVGVEEEGDEVVEQVLEEIGVDLTQAVSNTNPWAVSSWLGEQTLSLGRLRAGGLLRVGCFVQRKRLTQTNRIARRHTTRLASCNGARRQDCPSCGRRWRRRWRRRGECG